MDKTKLFNLFILAFIVSLTIQLFLFPKKDTSPINTIVSVSIKDDTITIPNIPQITLKNSSTWAINIHPCTDIVLKVDNKGTIGWIEATMPEFCKELTINPGESKHIDMNPLYKLFSSTTWKYVMSINTPYGERLVYFDVSAPGAIRSLISTIVYQPIYNLFVALLTWIPWHPLGWAIIIVTIIIRLILLVPQHHMLEWQKKLQKIQPKIKALQKEYKDDQATLGMKMLELYKTEKVNPVGSIVPLLIQMPILIGLYWVISQVNDPSNFYHLYSIFGDFNPTNIVTNFYGINLSHVWGALGICMAIILWSIQYIQAKLSFHYTEKKKKKEWTTEITEKSDEIPDIALDPAVMQKMMTYFFPLMIAISSYFFPLGVGLYWFIGTLFVIAQQAYVNHQK